MKKLATLLAPLALVALAQPLHAQDVTPEQEAIEARLLPVVVFRGEEDAAPSIDERRAELGVSTVSVAVFRDGELDWSQAYGEGVDSDTLYQAASLSKAVASAGIVALAMERGTSLDADISGELAGLDLDLINPDGQPITLRALLSHTNGAAVSGFPGYAVGVPMPTTAQVIEGSDITNTDTVVISAEGMGNYSYSGGGYTIAQYWAETVTGEDFPALMRRYVLDPIGMERSLFAALGPDEFPRENVTTAWHRGEAAVQGGWHRYPEHAAASLWTTPREYGLFALALLRALNGDGSAGITPEVVEELTRTVANEYGLGIAVNERDDEIRLSHSGSNAGYKSYFAAFPASGDAVVVMTDTDNGWALVSDINRTASVTYGWPSDPPVERSRLPLSASEMALFAGVYQMEDGTGPEVVIRPGDNDLGVYLPNGAELPPGARGHRDVHRSQRCWRSAVHSRRRRRDPRQQRRSDVCAAFRACGLIARA